MTLVNLDEFPSAHAEHIAHVLELHAEQAHDLAIVTQERLIADLKVGYEEGSGTAGRAQSVLNLIKDGQLSADLAASIRSRIG